MAFNTGFIGEIANIGAGEEKGGFNRILGHREYENGLKIGRFAKVDSGRLDNMDGSATPTIAGVVLRTPSTSVEAGDAINAELTTGSVSYMLNGLVTVTVKAGETPAYKGTVYASNAGDANDGMAQAVATDGIDTGAVFIEEVKDGVWLIEQK